MSIDIISYDEEVLDRLFALMLTICIAICTAKFLTYSEAGFNWGMIMLMSALAPLGATTFYKRFLKTTHFLIKQFGDGIKVSYEILSKLLKPYLFFFLILVVFNVCISLAFDIIAIHVLSLLYSDYILFLIFHYKIKISKIRSISIIILPFLILPVFYIIGLL